jgi:ArsR family transcriptional regulator
MITQACDPQKAAELLRALAHPMRLQILCRLLDGELSVSGFESELGLKQPNLSQQLGHLREAELVTTRREAKSIFYSLSDERVRGILDALRLVMGSSATPAAKPATRSTARPVARSAAAAPTATAVPAVPEPAGCGVFSIAGWPHASKQRNGTRG